MLVDVGDNGGTRPISERWPLLIAKILKTKSPFKLGGGAGMMGSSLSMPSEEIFQLNVKVVDELVLGLPTGYVGPTLGWAKTME